MSYLEDMIRKLNEIAEIKELNLKLTQALEDTLLWAIDYSEQNHIPMENAGNLSHLLEQVQTLMQKTKNFSASFLQHRKPSDDSYHEPSNRRKVNRTQFSNS